MRMSTSRQARVFASRPRCCMQLICRSTRKQPHVPFSYHNVRSNTGWCGRHAEKFAIAM